MTGAGSGIAGICKVTILPAARAFCCASAAPLKTTRTRLLDTRTGRTSVMLESPRKAVGSSEAGTAQKQVLERIAVGPEPDRTTTILAHPELGEDRTRRSCRATSNLCTQRS